MALSAHLEQLNSKHANLDTQIQDEMRSPMPDQPKGLAMLVLSVWSKTVTVLSWPIQMPMGVIVREKSWPQGQSALFLSNVMCRINWMFII